MDVGRSAAAVAGVAVVAAASLVATGVVPGSGSSSGSAASSRAVEATPSPPPSAAMLRVRRAIEDVAGADGSLVDAKDTGGRRLDGLKVVTSEAAGVPRYLGVAHDRRAGAFEVGLVTSDDLLTWRRVRTLGRRASQSTIRRLPDGGFLVAWEQEPKNHVRLRHFADVDALVAGDADATFDAPLTLAPTAEGTPDIRSVRLRDGLGDSTIELGLHYYRDRDVDREATATLTDFRTWTARRRPALDAALWRQGLHGNFGDRDTFSLGGRAYEVVEGQRRKGDFGSWRTYLRDARTGALVPLRMRAGRGQRAFGNPTVSILPGPDGGTVLFTTAFAFTQGARRGGAGELVSFRRVR